MDDLKDTFCPDASLSEVIGVLQTDDMAGLSQIDALLQSHPNDPRLHFLQGSVLAGVQRYEEGRVAMARSIAIAPDFDLARFQLGFLEFTSGMITEATQTWGPFNSHPDGNYFRLFSKGLENLARDEFSECRRLLELGIKMNTDHVLINGDMQLILDEIAELDASPVMNDDVAQTSEPVSAVHQLLQQFELKDSVNKTKH